MLIFFLIVVYVSVCRAADCSLPICDVNGTCYADTADAMDCLESIPFNIEWATATVDVISQSLENYGFLSLYHSTGPPYVINLDIMAELNETQAMINSGVFVTDMDFQEHMQALIQITEDAHTRYQKPVCYNAVFLQPFSFDVRVVEVDQPSGAVQNQPRAFLMRNEYTDRYSEMFPESAGELGDLLDGGLEVSFLDGLEFTTAVSSWGDSHETRSNNRGARFNAAVRSFLYRSAVQYTVRPLTALSLTMADGSDHSFEWMATYTTGLANLTYCAALPAEDQDSRRLSARGPDPTSTVSQSLINPTHHPRLLDPAQPLARAALHDERPDREEILPADSAFMVSCFAQKVSSADASAADVSTVLVMKVASFAPAPESNFSVAWTGFLRDVQTCMSTTEYDLMVVDVMQNGGGYVCLGLRLLELLVEDYYDNHTLVQMNYDLPHSDLMDRYIDTVNAPDPVPDESGGIIDKATQLPFPDGKSYYYGRNVTMGGVAAERSNYFSLDCRKAEALPADGWRPSRWMSPDKLILLTDGEWSGVERTCLRPVLCVLACAVFLLILCSLSLSNCRHLRLHLCLFHQNSAGGGPGHIGWGRWYMGRRHGCQLLCGRFRVECGGDGLHRERVWSHRLSRLQDQSALAV